MCHSQRNYLVYLTKIIAATWSINKIIPRPGSKNTIANGAEGIHDFGDLCKYGHVRQAKGGGPGLSFGTSNPPLKQTNEGVHKNKQTNLTKTYYVHCTD